MAAPALIMDVRGSCDSDNSPESLAQYYDSVNVLPVEIRNIRYSLPKEHLGSQGLLSWKLDLVELSDSTKIPAMMACKPNPQSPGICRQQQQALSNTRSRHLNISTLLLPKKAGTREENNPSRTGGLLHPHATHTAHSTHTRWHLALHGAHHLGHAALAHLLHGAGHLLMLLEQAVEVLHLQAGTHGNALLA